MTMSIFTDRRSLKQIGGLRAYLRQVSWSLRWQMEWRRRVRRTVALPEVSESGPAVLRLPPPGARGGATEPRTPGAGSRRSA